MTTVIDLLSEQMRQRSNSDSSWFVSLNTALDGVTASIASWRPNEQFNTIWQLVNHLTFWTEFVSNRLDGSLPTGKRIDNQSTFGEPGNPSDDKGWSSAVAKQFFAYNQFYELLAQASVEDMNRVLNSAGTAASTMIGGCLLHDSYHIGQIVLLRRLQGVWINQK